MVRVLPPDLARWLIDYIRDVVLPSIGDLGIDVEVSNKEPAEGEFPAALIVVRDDGGPRTSVVSSTRSVGISVLAGTRLYDAPAIDLAAQIMAAVTAYDLPIIGGAACPIVAVTDFNGPYSVSETEDRTRMYFTAEYVVVGSLIQ